jgi:hypothetical protein
LQQAQRIAAEAEKKKSQKCQRNDDKSKWTLKQHKKCQENLAKQGYLSVFEFIAYMEELAKKKEHLEQLTARTLEHDQELEESETEEVDTNTLVSKHVSQVCCRDLLMC